jgi:hypothetical protein
MHNRARLRALALRGVLPAAIGLGVALGFAATHRGHAPARQGTRAAAASANFRVLSKQESRRLIAYAQHVHRCLVVHHEQGISPPIVSPTRITMPAPNRSARSLVVSLTVCEPSVGAPPPGASLQARANQILVYLPKRCLLDPAALRSGGSATKRSDTAVR